MGDVFECMDERLGKAVAVKVSHTALADDPDVLDQIRDEARRLANIKDRRFVLRVLSAGDVEMNGVLVPYVAMEYEDDAETLGGPISNAWPIERKVEFFVQVCRAVQSLHEQHLVHADIKPSNILVVSAGGGEPRLIDFGIARVVRRLGGEPEQLAGGTPGYLDPALLADPNLRPDQRTDVYCLGVTLAEFIAAKSPEQPSGPGDESWPSHGRPPSEHAATIDAELDAIILRAIDHSPAARFQSAEGLADALTDWLAFHRSIPARIGQSISGAARTSVRAAARWPILGQLMITLGAGLLAFALSPLLFQWTTAARLFQPLAARTETPPPALQSVRIIELRDADRFAALARERGVDITLDRPGAGRLVWASLARRLAEAGGARTVGFDLMFRGEFPFDRQLRQALVDLAAASESRSVVIGLERWGDQPPPSLRAPEAPGAIRAACIRIHESDAGTPPMAQLAVLEPQERYALPSFALLLASLADRPGWEPQIILDRAHSRITTEFARTDESGVRRRHNAALVLPDQVIQPLPASDTRASASDRWVGLFPIQPASEQALDSATKDAGDVLIMSPENLRAWIGGRTVILCDGRDGADSRFTYAGRSIPGAALQAATVESLLSDRFLRLPSTEAALLLTLIAAGIGSIVGALAASVTRGWTRITTTLLCLMFGSFAVLLAGSGGLLLAAQARYFLNPVVIILSALLAFGCAYLVQSRARLHLLIPAR